MVGPGSIFKHLEVEGGGRLGVSTHPLDPPIPPQQISRHQEQFIQMLNEPPGELADLSDTEGEGGAMGEETPQMNYIQVTPQEKEAIERVSNMGLAGAQGHPPPPRAVAHLLPLPAAEGAGVPRELGRPGLLRL